MQVELICTSTVFSGCGKNETDDGKMIEGKVMQGRVQFTQYEEGIEEGVSENVPRWYGHVRGMNENRLVEKI